MTNIRFYIHMKSLRLRAACLGKLLLYSSRVARWSAQQLYSDTLRVQRAMQRCGLNDSEMATLASNICQFGKARRHT